MEATFNRSIKIIAGLQYQTHIYLLGPLLGKEHMRTKLLRNYLGFIKRIRNSSKPVLRLLYSLASSDARTVTGTNLRNILLLTDRLQVDDLEPSLMDTIKYHQVEDIESWRIRLVMELLDIQHGDVDLPDEWSEDDLETILNLACTQ